MIGRYKLVESGNDTWTGYNIKTDEIVNMKKEGIIDPTKVTRVALRKCCCSSRNSITYRMYSSK